MISIPFEIISEENFSKKVLENNLPVIVFFGAERCSVCKELLPVFEDFIKEFTMQMVVYWIDVDKEKNLRVNHRIKGIPTLILFKDGEMEGRIGGMHSKEELSEFVNRYL